MYLNSVLEEYLVYGKIKCNYIYKYVMWTIIHNSLTDVFIHVRINTYTVDYRVFLITTHFTRFIFS